MEQPFERPTVDHSHVKGWGVDTDLQNDPTYPMKKRNDGEHSGYSWERPPQQPVDIEVLHSNERPNVTAVFGTSLPPSGLSGTLRRFAFKYSESSYGHWLPLMMADRIAVFEGRLHDLTRGHLPNPFREQGWSVEWKYNKARLLLKLFVKLLIVAAVGAIAAWILVERGVDLWPFGRNGR